ncbi:hypothetical protein KIW84_041809 [Lathyrus oleraceus]|uniref:Reverse transcriptase zinc-binding domain-containing protein n=1 Tax=Pisum sativum TaxID=3888 RepID=A0A9D4X9L3_PEA|nr:hypothetical protein KIW84_041809 [Pisum sativum]
MSIYLSILPSQQRRNLITEACWTENVQEVKKQIRDHLEASFKESNFHRPNLDGVEFKQLSWEERLYLETPFDVEEVKEVVWQSENDKSPGPEGFNMNLFKACWDIFKEDVLNFAKFFCSSKLPRTVITYLQSPVLKTILFGGLAMEGFLVKVVYSVIKRLYPKFLAEAWRQIYIFLPSRGVLADTTSLACPMCSSSDEDVPHLFCLCVFSNVIWNKVCCWLDIDSFGMAATLVEQTRNGRCYGSYGGTKFRGQFVDATSWTEEDTESDALNSFFRIPSILPSWVPNNPKEFASIVATKDLDFVHNLFVDNKKSLFADASRDLSKVEYVVSMVVVCYDDVLGSRNLARERDELDEKCEALERDNSKDGGNM